MQTVLRVGTTGMWKNYVNPVTFTSSNYQSGDSFPASLSLVKVTGFKLRHYGKYYANVNRYTTFFQNSASTSSSRVAAVVRMPASGSYSSDTWETTDYAGVSSFVSTIQNSIFSSGGSGWTVCLARCTSAGAYTTGDGNTGTTTYIELIIDWQYALTKSTFTPTDAVIGGNMKITFANSTDISLVQHEIYYKFHGDDITEGWFCPTFAAGTITASSLVQYVGVTNEFLMELTTKTSGQIDLTLISSAGGVELGRDTKSVTLSLGGNKPTISSVNLSATYDSSVVAAWGVHVQGYSSAYFIINASPADDFTSITEYTVQVGNGAPVTSSYRYISIKMNEAGTLPYSVTVKDSRGVTSTPKTGSLTVFEYKKPEIIPDKLPYRCNASGMASAIGTYGAGSFAGSVSSVGGRNTMTLQIGVTTSTLVTPTIVKSDVSAGETTVFGGSYSTELTYYVYYYVKDALNTTYEYYELSTSSYAFHVMKGGNGVAFGKTSEIQNAVEITSHWNFHVHGQEIDQRYMKASSISFSSLVKSQSVSAAASATQATQTSITATATIPNGAQVKLTGWSIYNAGYRNFYPVGTAGATASGTTATFTMTIANTVTSAQTAYVAWYYVILQ